MAKLKIDEADLLMAVEGFEMMSFYLDRETGEVIGLSDDSFLYGGGDLDEEDEPDDEAEEEEDEDDDDDDDDDDEAAMRRRIEAGYGERYLPIEPMPSHEAFRIMEDFVDSLPDGRACDALGDALNRRRPFRSFKDALHDFPDVREQWFRYHEARLRQEALAWLEIEGINAELFDKYAG